LNCSKKIERCFESKCLCVCLPACLSAFPPSSHPSLRLFFAQCHVGPSDPFPPRHEGKISDDLPSTPPSFLPSLPFWSCPATGAHTHYHSTTFPPFSPSLPTVLPGGRLDTRFLIMVRGGGRYVLPDRSARLSMGTHVRVQIGGDYTATGVLFRERNNTLQSFMKELENTASFQFRYLNFNLGQYVTVVGGNLFLQGCFFLRLRSYGVGYLTNFSLGREVLVIAGNAVFTGVHNIVHTLFASYPWMSGKVACVLGGTLTMIGGSSVYSSGPQLQIGYAIDLACLGGVLVTVGWSYAAAVVAMLRVGGGQIGVGAGTVYHTGLNYARAWVVGGAFGAGQTFVCGAGNFQFIGGSYASFINNAMFAGVGGNTWVGAGSLTWIGVPQARFYGTLNVYGLGGIYYNGAGTTTFIFLPQYSSYVAFYQVGIATDTFIGAGWLTSIQNTRVSYALVYGFNGLGTQMYIGAGGAIFIKTYSYYKRLKYWTTWPYTYTVGGFGIKPKFLKNDTVIVLTKDTYTNIQYNKETGVWKKKITARNFTLLGGRRGLDGEEENQRPVARTRRQNHYQRSLQEASQWLTDAVSTLGAVAVDKLKDSSIVLVDSTVYEATGSQPVSRTFFSDGIKSSQDPYAMAASLRDPDATDVTAGAVAAADDAQCFLCDVGPGETEEHADGDGICEVAQGCKGTDPLDSWEKATERTDQDLTFPQMDFLPGMRKDQTEQGLPDTYFLWYEMTVYCYSQDEATVDSTITSGCLSEPYVKDIITAFVDDDLDGGYDLAIAATALHAAALSFLPDDDMAAQGLNEAMRPAWNPECQGWTKYNIQFTTRENSMYVDLQKMFDAVVASPGDMGITMVDNYDRTLDVQPCEVSMIKKSNIKYPSFKKMPAFFPSKRGNLGPDVVVADVGSIVAADKIEAGKTYHIFAQNFPKGSNVQLSLMSADADPVQVASIPNFDDNDVNSVEWTAPLDLDEDTRFYIKGAPAAFPNLFGNSQLLRSNMFKRRRD